MNRRARERPEKTSGHYRDPPDGTRGSRAAIQSRDVALRHVGPILQKAGDRASARAANVLQMEGYAQQKFLA